MDSCRRIQYPRVSERLGFLLPGGVPRAETSTPNPCRADTFFEPSGLEDEHRMSDASMIVGESTTRTIVYDFGLVKNENIFTLQKQAQESYSGIDARM